MTSGKFGFQARPLRGILLQSFFWAPFLLHWILKLCSLTQNMITSFHTKYCKHFLRSQEFSAPFLWFPDSLSSPRPKYDVPSCTPFSWALVRLDNVRSQTILETPPLATGSLFITRYNSCITLLNHGPYFSDNKNGVGSTRPTPFLFTHLLCSWLFSLFFFW